MNSNGHHLQKVLRETENPSPHWLDLPLATSFFCNFTICVSAYTVQQSLVNRSWKDASRFTISGLKAMPIFTSFV